MSHLRGLLFRSRLFSPGGLLLRAAVLSLCFLLVHLLGLREYTSIVCGTSPTADQADTWAIFLGTSYIVLYFIFVLVVPILFLGGMFFLVMELIRGRRKG